MKTKTTKNPNKANLFLKKLQVSFKYQALILLFIFSFTASCSKEEPDKNEEGNNPNIELELIDINVELPDDVSIDFSKTEITTYLEAYDVKENGNSKAYVPKNDKSFVYLSDTEGNIIIMGFVSKDRPVLNVKSTLEAAIYFSLGTAFQLDEIQARFLDEFQDLGEIEPYVKELETMYASNTLLLKSESFSTWLNETAKKLIAQEEVINAGKSIKIESTTIKSGVAVFADESDVFSVNVLNYWRRRAKAFFYKTYEKKKGQTSFDEILNPLLIGANNVKADTTVVVDPVAGLTSIQGNTMEIALGNGSNLGFTKNGPVKLELSDQQTAVKYQVRVFGPGSSLPRTLTKYEEAAITKIKLEILILDFVIPVVTTAVGFADIKDIDKKYKIDGKIEIINGIIASSQAGLDALNEGNYKTASIEFIKGLVNNAPGTELFWEYVVEGLRDEGLDKLVDYDDMAAKLAAPLNIVNGVLTGGDIIRGIWASVSAQELELFQVTVSRGKVRINKSHQSISANEAIRLKTKVLDDENIEPNEYKYIWTTTGKYGNFNSNSETDEIIFETEKSLPVVPPNTRKDSIFVSVFKKDKDDKYKTLVGKDSTAINIDNGKFKIKPNGFSIQGGDRLRLSIVDKNDNPMELDTDEGLFKVNYVTIGDFGTFSHSLKSIIGDAENSTIYQPYDRDVEKGTEKIQAYIQYYDKANGYNSTIIQGMEATINIDNNPNDGFFVGFEKHAPISEAEGFILGGGCTDGIVYLLSRQYFSATFKDVENAVTYRGRILQKNNVYGSEFTIYRNQLNDLGGGIVQFQQNVPPSFIFFETCEPIEAQDKQKDKFELLEEVGHLGMEITPVF